MNTSEHRAMIWSRAGLPQNNMLEIRSTGGVA